MFKSITLGALALVMGMTGAAFASKLDPKWAASRKDANAMGDAVKAGDKRAFQMLVNKAALGDAPAMHNIGWLYQKGFPDNPANPEKSCGWFGKAAKRGYPPSIHNHGLCLFASAKKANGKAARTKLEQQAYKALFDASKAGWTKSAIYMSEKIMNLPRPSNADFSIAGMVIDYGLGSTPAHEQKVTLSYFKGMRAVYGSGGGSYYYKTARDALLFADKNGHLHAGKAIPALYSKWVRSHIKSMTAWSPPKLTGIECYRDKQASAASKARATLECTGYDSRKKKKLERLKKVSETLQFEVSPKDKTDLQSAMKRLDKRSAQFLAGVTELTNIFAREMSKKVPK